MRLTDDDLILNKYSIVTLEQNIQHLNKKILLATQKLTPVFCVKYILDLDIDNGICNGSIGKVVDFIEDSKTQTNLVPVVLFSNGHKVAMSIKYWQSEDYPTIAVGKYPLCLAWAMTIHKIQ